MLPAPRATQRPKLRLGVLASGNGSNLQALIDACATEGFPAEVALVLSDVAGARALQRAQRAGLVHRALPLREFESREAFDGALAHALSEAKVDLVCLAGFMKLLGKRFLSAFPGRVLNIHPALLPAFPGLHAVRQALAHGVRLTGCTVHFVDEGVDTGPIVAQAAVPVLPNDDEAALSARVQQQEHRLYPLAVRAVADGRVTMVERKVKVEGRPAVYEGALFNPGDAPW